MTNAIAAKPFWARVVLLGIGLYLLVGLAYALGGLANGEPDVLIFVLISSLPALLIGLFILRFGAWSYVFGAVVSVIGLLFFGTSLPTAISSPNSFFDFAGTLVSTVALLMILVGCIVAFFQRNEPVATGSPTAIVAIKGIVAALAVLSIMSAVFTVASIEKVSAADKQGAILVRADKTEWNTESIEGRSDGTLKLLIKNSDPFLHTFTVDGLNMDFKVTPGSEKLIVLERPLAGTYEFICTIAGHENMKGTLTIR